MVLSGIGAAVGVAVLGVGLLVAPGYMSVKYYKKRKMKRRRKKMVAEAKEHNAMKMRALKREQMLFAERERMRLQMQTPCESLLEMFCDEKYPGFKGIVFCIFYTGCLTIVSIF